MLCVKETRKTGGLGVEDLPYANRYEPLDASHGAQIMAREVGAVLFNFFFFMYDQFSVALKSITAISYNVC